MKALFAVLFFLPVWHRQKEQRLIEKVPVKLTVRPFPQKDLMDSLLTSRLMEQRFALIDQEEMLQRAKKAGQFFGGSITNISNPGATREEITEKFMRSFYAMPPFAQSLTVTVKVDKDQRYDSCYFILLPVPSQPGKVKKRVLADSLVHKNDVRVLVEAIAGMILPNKRK